MMNYKMEYDRWLVNTTGEINDELKNMSEAGIEDAFYRDLAFGTGGLRGTLGAGTNRMNTYVVGKATQGLANYLNKSFSTPSVVIGFDSRIKSDLFARVAAEVFAANGIHVYLWPYLSPVPTVSYAVRKLGVSCGVMITASHNPSKYNGYKVYGSDGCQITTEAAKAILAEIEKVDVFEGVKSELFMEGLASDLITNIDDEVMDSFISEVKNCSVLFGDKIDHNLKIIYSPLNGTGLVPVTRVLEEAGFKGVKVVEEQRLPDGNFPTCPYPNPEVRESMELGIRYAEKEGADLLLATDPDADRCGIAVRNPQGEYQLLSGNEVGLLLLDFICSQRIKHNKMPSNPVFIKTIVTMDLAEKIAEHYRVRTINVLTGFKFIGEQIGILEDEHSYICGFEESYGYLTGSYVRDKDAVNAAFMICEMFAFYKTRGISLIDKLSEIYATYGYCLNTLHSYQFEGSSGMAKMRDIMASFRNEYVSCSNDETAADAKTAIGGLNIQKIFDYSEGLDGLPKSDVIKYLLEGGSSLVIRPSGTEPKLKAYISVIAENNEAAADIEKRISTEIENVIY